MFIFTSPKTTTILKNHSLRNQKSLPLSHISTKKNNTNVQRDQSYRQTATSSLETVRGSRFKFSRVIPVTWRVYRYIRISLAYKAFRARWNVFTIWKASIRLPVEEERASTDNYPRVPASQSYFLAPRKGWAVKNSVTIIKTVDIVSGCRGSIRRRIVKTFVINCHWLGRCNEPLQTRIKIKERAVVMAGR